MSDNTPRIAAFTLTITINEKSELQFNYTYKGEDFDGPFYVKEKELISYQLVDNTGKGLKFIGAAFITPFDKVIDSVSIKDNGEQLNLLDTDSTIGETGFNFVLSNTDNTLMVLSPDPQIINRGKD